MKINPIGIQAYRQTVGEAQVNKKATSTESVNNPGQTDRVVIPGQGDATGSKLSVQLKNGNFLDMLSTEERKALEMLFDKFKNAGSEGLTYEKKGTSEKSRLGNIVDVRL
jgi:hypothetical protein